MKKKLADEIGKAYIRLLHKERRMTKIGKVKVNNLSEKHSRYVVCRLVDGELWFYTSWKYREDAENAVKEFENGLVVEVEE